MALSERDGPLVDRPLPMLQTRVQVQGMAIYLINKFVFILSSGYGAVGWETIAGKFEWFEFDKKSRT